LYRIIYYSRNLGSHLWSIKKPLEYFNVDSDTDDVIKALEIWV
jgi:hypothetical protein